MNNPECTLDYGTNGKILLTIVEKDDSRETRELAQNEAELLLSLGYGGEASDGGVVLGELVSEGDVNVSVEGAKIDDETWLSWMAAGIVQLLVDAVGRSTSDAGEAADTDSAPSE